MCHISNYSKYAEVIVVENDRTLFKKSTKDLSFGCLPNVPDSSSATCTVNVSTSLHSGQLHYKLCVGYNSSVPHTTALQCSKDITINITESSGKVVGCRTYPALLVYSFSGFEYTTGQGHEI